MRINRGLVFWGVALIAAGVMALLLQSGAITDDVARQAWQLWPVILIVIGLAVIAGRSPLALAATVIAALTVGVLAGSLIGGLPDGLGIGCGGEVDELATEEGTFTGAAGVTLHLNCGELKVSTAPGDAWNVEAGYAGDARPRIEAAEGSLRVEHAGGGRFFVFGNDRQEWDITLPSEVAITLEISANAASVQLDLADADLPGLSLEANAGLVDMNLAGSQVEDLEIGANAGSVRITTDAATRLWGRVSVNAGSLELCAPDGASLLITIEDNLTFSHNLDDRGLFQSGDTWSTRRGLVHIQLEVEGNAGSFSLNPSGGCT